MLYTRITKEEMYRVEDHAFNPPEISVAFTMQDFHSEWKNVQSQIKCMLEGFGYKSWNEGGEDYTMPDDWGPSRHHEIEINKWEMLEKRIVPMLQVLLSKLRNDYAVAVCHDLFLRNEIKPFCILVRKDEITVSAGDDYYLEML